MSSSGKSKSSLSSGYETSMYIPGKIWERPIPRCEDYWAKLCDDEAKRLIVVRNPFRELSHRILSKHNPDLVNFNLHADEKDSNCKSCPDSLPNDRKTLENSLHKLSPVRSKSKTRKDHFEDRKSLSTPILKSSSRPGSKISVSTSNLTVPSQIVRIPKLDTRSPQPTSDEIPAGKVDRIRAPFSVENEPKLRGKGSPTLPSLATFSKPPNPELTLKKLQKYSRLLEKKDSNIRDQPRNKVAGVKNKKPSRKVDETVEKDQTVLTDEESLKYSARFAYKALKRVLKNKRLDFEPKTNEYSQENLQLASSNDSSTRVDEHQDLLELKHAVAHKREEYPSFKDSEFSRADVELETLKSEETTSRTIPTSSRSTSGPSPQFAYPENSKSPAACRVLASIPKLSGYPRKNCDKCLPCMYKTFEPPRKRIASLPRTLLQRIVVHSEGERISSSRDSTEDSDESSSSLSMPSFENELEKSWNYEAETPDLGLEEERNAAESRVVTEPAPVPQEKREQLAETVRQKNIPDTNHALKAITRKGKEDQRDDDSTLKNLTDVETSCARDPSFEGTKVSSSFHSESSDEGDSNIVSMAADRSKLKFLVPCHAATNLRPSLEPLRALRNRKATTLKDRIAMLESSTVKKKSSTDSFDEIPEKPSSETKQPVEKGKTSEGEVKTIPPPLTKAKSMLENLTAEEAGKRRRVLRKGVTLSSLPLSKDLANAEETHSDASTESNNATPREDSLEAILEKHFTRPHSKLPLASAKEIVEILKNLDENASTTDILDSLCDEFCKRLADNVERDDPDTRERKMLIGSLTRLLTDSKRYTYTDKFPSDSHFSTTQPSACNPRFLRRLLPIRTFNTVAPLLDIPEWLPERRASFRAKLKAFERSRPSDAADVDDDTSTFDSLQVHPSTPRDTESLGDGEEKMGHPRYNPYGLFLTKPRRKAVTWRPLTKRDLEGYDPEATLEMRAENMMKRICQDFCKWVDSLGGTDKTIDEDVLRDMFEIDFSAEACRAMQVLIREMPVVPAEVAITRNCPGAGQLTRTKKHVTKDMKAEQRAPKTKAFGRALPPELRFVPPKNDVQRKWLECESVPLDLETMDMVWKDITHLKSVRGFVEWLQQHPEVPPPEALKKIVSMDIRALRQVEDEETSAHLELDVDQIQSLRVAVNNDG